MAETRYIISDAAKIINVEPHVLRYWEEELSMEIPRNELGHRYYTEKEIHLFENIRDLKEKGFQLKAIRLIITTLNEDAPFEHKEYMGDEVLEEELVNQSPKTGIEHVVHKDDREETDAQKMDDEVSNHLETIDTKPEVSPEDKLKHFKYMMNAIVSEALENNNLNLENAMAVQVTDVLIQALDKMEQRQEMQSERYYKLLDETIRNKQNMNQEVAAAKVPAFNIPRLPKRKRSFFKRRYKY